MTASTDRLPRLLALVPWLLAHPDTPIDRAAAEFGVTPEQLQADLNLIWMCGVPGHGPGDLIDVFISGDRVTLANADTIAAPLRLTQTETLALVAALRTLRAQPGLADADAVERALAKLEAAAGAAAATAEQVAVAAAEPSAAAMESVLATVREALIRQRRLRIDYWVPARDEVTTRDVDPIRLVSGAAANYLIGWCRLVEAVRTFRLDRILAAQLLAAPAQVPEDAAAAERDPALYRPGPQDREVRLRVQPAGRWLVDYYPVESVTDHPDGTTTVTLRAHDDQWVCRLALSLAGSGELLEPSELVAEVQARAREALAAYADDENGHGQ